MNLNQEQLLQKIIKKAWEDPAFKHELISNPELTIENVAGKKLDLQEGKKIVVRDQTDTNIIYLNIPVKVNMEDMELNEEQLEIVAGGGTLTNPFSRKKKSR